MRRIVVIPAVLAGCMLVIWIGTVAAAQMPPLVQLEPTLTAQAAAQPISSQTLMASEQNLSMTKHSEELTCNLPQSYPASILQWCHAIESNAHETGLPARLIAAVIFQESGGDPQAYSSSGAVGLMQVMPRDGLATEFMCINGPCFAARPTIAELAVPDFNLAYGSQMLADLYNRSGSYREALFRYGPMDMGYVYADRVIHIWETYQ